MENLEIKIMRTYELMKMVKGDMNLKNTSIIMFLDELQTISPEYENNESFHIIYLDDITTEADIKNTSLFDEMICSLCDFIESSVNKRNKIYISCDCGISRSSACAAAIKERYYRDGISIFADERYKPNKIIYKAILKKLFDKNIELSTCLFNKINDTYPNIDSKDLFRIIKIINRYDPENLVDIGAPDDEYLPEAKRVLEIIRNNKVLTPEDVFNIFKEMFGNSSMRLKQAINIADDIKIEFGLIGYD